MKSFIPKMGRVSSSYVCVREIISRRKWHQRTLCCELTILHLALSVCSYFIIWSPFKVWYRKAHCCCPLALFGPEAIILLTNLCGWLSWCFFPMCSSLWESHRPCCRSSAKENQINTGLCSNTLVKKKCAYLYWMCTFSILQIKIKKYIFKWPHLEVI